MGRGRGAGPCARAERSRCVPGSGLPERARHGPLLRRSHRPEIPVAAVRAGLRPRVHRRRHGEHVDDDPDRVLSHGREGVRRLPAGRAPLPRARPSVVRRLPHLPGVGSHLAERILRHVLPGPVVGTLLREGRRAHGARDGPRELSGGSEQELQAADRHDEVPRTVRHVRSTHVREGRERASHDAERTRRRPMVEGDPAVREEVRGPERRDERFQGGDRRGDRTEPRRLLRPVALPRRPPGVRTLLVVGRIGEAGRTADEADARVKDPVPLFKVPASVELAWPDRTQRETIRIEQADQVFRFDAPRRPRAVLFDPDDTLLKKVTFKKARDELLWQLANAVSVWPRIEACRDLGKLAGDAKAIEGLEDALKKDKFWGVRREAAVALGEIGTAAARDALLSGTKDEDSRVRRGVYRALGNFRRDEVAFRALAKAYRDDGWYYPMNAAALALAETRHEQAFETIVKGMDRRSQGEILARGACMAIANLRDTRGFPELEKRTSDEYLEMVRYGAALAFGKLGSFHESRRDEVLGHLSMLVRDPNYRTRLGATLGLGELGYPPAENELQRVSEAEPMSNLRTNARKAIATLREKHAEAAKKVEQQAELDKLKDENKELRSRITAIEARVEAIGKRRKR